MKPVHQNFLPPSGPAVGWLLLSCLTGSLHLSATTPTADRTGLIALYQATGGDGWVDNTGWKEAPRLEDGFNDDPCTPPLWFGVVCDQQPRVESVDLRRNGLEGTLPPQLENLTEMTALDLSANQLEGAIPGELGNLSKLEFFNLSANGLSGDIPAQLSDLAALEVLILSSNGLQGTIPPQLGDLSTLSQLRLGNNRLEGSIPLKLEELTGLTWLSLPFNQLTGSIPPELGNMANLSTLNLASNRLTGPIPAQLGDLSNLRTALLEDNHLEGPIPAQLGNLPSLRRLDLYGNHLTGEVPATLAALPVGILDLRDNRLDSVEAGLDDGLNLAQKGDVSWNTQQYLSAVYPQLAMGGGFEVVLMISSRSHLPWTGTAYLDGGLWPPERPWQLDDQEMTGQSSFPVVLGPEATLRLVLSSSSETAVDGWLLLRAEGDSQPEDVAAAYFYNLSGQSGLADSTGIGPSPLGNGFFFPVERAGTPPTVLTGVALRSRGDEVSVKLWDREGEFVTDIDVDEDGAFLVGDLFPDLPANFIGSIEVSSRGAFFVTVVRVEVTQASGVQLTSVPATRVQ